MSWRQLGLDIDGEFAGDQSGWSVDLSSDGTTLAIGTPYNDENGSNSGHVRVYSWDSSAWVQRGLDIDGEDSYDQSGYSVSLSSDGNTVAIGYKSSKGRVRVYNWNGSYWQQRGSDIDGEASNNSSVYSVCLSSDGNTLAIGAPDNSPTNDYYTTGIGRVRVYYWDGLSWTKIGQDIYGENRIGSLGKSVSLSSDGNTLAIGAPNENGNQSGNVKVYDLIISSWQQRGLDIDGEASSDNSGYSVSLSSDGNIVAIGAINKDGNNVFNSGQVRVYNWNSSTSLWQQMGQDIDGESFFGNSGYSVSLSSDGNTLAIGAPNENPNTSGHVRVYSWNGSSWQQTGSDIDGEASRDISGYSVSLSSDGLILAIGAPNNEGNGSYSGHVRVYKFGKSQPVFTVNNSITKIYGESPFTLASLIQSNNSEAPIITISNVSSDNSVSIVNNLIHINNNTNGLITFTASQPETESYLSISQDFTINIVENTQNNPASLTSLDEFKNFLTLNPKPKYWTMTPLTMNNVVSGGIKFVKK